MSSQSSPQFVTRTATSTAAFIDSIGVNTHIAFDNSPYVNIDKVSTALDYLGIQNIRDNLYTTTLASNSFSVLAAQGYKFDFVATPSRDSTIDVSKFIAALDTYASQYPGSISAIEGPNEVNIWQISYNGVISIASGAEVQKQIFTAVNADNLLKDIPVYNVSIGSTDSSQFQQLGNLSGYTDYANEHAYVMSTTPVSNGLDYLLSFAQISAPGKPTVITEAGYNTLTSYWYNGVNEAVQAKYTLNTLMDAYQKGVSHTYLYELLDEPNLGADNKESYFGLFHSDGSPKPVATAIHNLTQILRDSGQNASGASGSLTYALSGAPAMSHDMVFAKSNGSVDLVLWAEPVLWNQNAHSEVKATASIVTVTLDKTVSLVKVYDPIVSSNPIATYANVGSIQVSISDHPLVIEVTPVIKNIAAAPAPLPSTTTSTYVGGVLASETITYSDGSKDVSDIKVYTAGELTRETILHTDGSKDIYLYNIKNQSYVSEHDVFNASGVLTSSIRTHGDGTFDYVYSLAADGTKTTDKYNSAGFLLSETVFRADGSSDVKTYTNGVITNQTVKYASGPVGSIVSTYAGGTLASEVIKYAVGSADAFEIKTYTNGVLTKDDIVHADNSEDVYYYNVQNKDYVAGHDTYNSARVLTSSVRTHADGTLGYSYTLAADGTKTTDVYDAAGSLASDTIVRPNGFSDVKIYSKGVLTGETIKFAPGGPDLSEVKIYSAGILTSDTIVHADKSKDIYLSGIQNKSYVAEHDVYNAAGVLTSVVRSHADGSLDYTYTLSSDGTKITDVYNASGALVSDSVVRANGWSEVKTYANGQLSSDVVRYAPGSADLIDSKTYTAGVLTNETIVHASKAKDVFDWNVTGKSYVADHFVYDAAGRMVNAEFTNVDGSHSQTAYLAGVALTSTKSVSDTLTAASAGGDTFIFKPNSGNDTIIGFHAGDGANHDTIVLDNSVVHDFSQLVMQQIGRDTLIKLDAQDSILVKNVLPSALTSADFHFVQHDWTLS
ncbi:hypothetical protein [Bradyrhizobium sp. I71]|uniref:hypothetical protein n=1 Tax=Bradyrhizobium sp. I71 TaxID=2590772 RepID=UPI001EF9ADBC|nr:hypothetical protein [Bradyrhizobium sp. I71]ULK95969.1 hypothetical protein FJV43_24840 [Bradyrhizobium sp. I71]